MSVERLCGHTEYVVVNPGLADRVKVGLTSFYQRHGGGVIQFVDDSILKGANGDIDPLTGVIRISKSLRDKWPHLLQGTILEELQHFHQLVSRGWLGRVITKGESCLLEDGVVRRLLRSGLDFQQ